MDKLSQQRGALAALLLVSSLATASDCPEWALSPSVGLTRSVWQEYSASGSRLVKEAGTLHTTRLDAQLTCGRAQWQLQGAQSQGQRTYWGVTNTNVPATTVSDISEQSLRGNVWVEIVDRWSGGLGVEQRTIHRHIQSTAQASGYPERFEQMTSLVGLRYERPVSEATQVAAVVWAGRTSPGKMRLDLPDADPVQLSLGKGHVWQGGLTWGSKKTHQPGWSWSSSLTWREATTTKGKTSAIFRNGRLIGSAHQPKTSTRSVDVLVGLQYAF